MANAGAGVDQAVAAAISSTLIIGTGLVGASIGCALSQAGVDVRLQDRVRSHAVVASSRGAGRVGSPEADDVKLVVVAVPPDAIPKVVRRSLQRYPQATVTDVGSVKLAVEQALQHIDTSRYVGSHPMAGSQYAGPLAAVPELFIDRTWVIVPGRSSVQAQTQVHTLARICGARPIVMDAESHDRAVAVVSHLPQLMSSLTAARLAAVPTTDLQLAGQGVRDVTRIAASDPDLWRQIIAANATEIGDQLRAIRTDLDILIAGLDQPSVVAELLNRGRSGVAALPGKHGRRPELTAVVVRIPDASGALARLFADIQREGINIEDLAIEHDPTREVGYLSVQVATERAEHLRDAMRGAGWEIRSWQA